MLGRLSSGVGSEKLSWSLVFSGSCIAFFSTKDNAFVVRTSVQYNILPMSSRRHGMYDLTKHKAESQSSRSLCYERRSSCFTVARTKNLEIPHCRHAERLRNHAMNCPPPKSYQSTKVYPHVDSVLVDMVISSAHRQRSTQSQMWKCNPPSTKEGTTETSHELDNGWLPRTRFKHIPPTFGVLN